MKTEFISTVSHELRTPLTSIRGSLGLVLGGVAGELPGAVKTLVDIANKNCERLIRLINDILDSEKIESGEMRLDLKVVNMAQLVQQAMAANEGFASQHGVKLALQAPDERTRHLPVVVILALAGEGRLQCNQKLLTVSDWLEKPIDESRLVHSVRQAVAGSKRAKPRILHVEDDPDIQSVVAAVVQDSAVFEFSATLSEARALLRENSFDLILLDLALGEDSGWSLFEDIDTLNPVVSMTAKVQAAEVALYKSMGALEVISKPFDPMKLSEQLRQVWAARP